MKPLGKAFAVAAFALFATTAARAEQVTLDVLYAFPAFAKALTAWKELTAPRAVNRSPEHMPIGV